MAPPSEDVYCTLLLNDAYLPGAQVLAHSLRDGGSTHRLAVMVTLGSVSPRTVTELKHLYDYVIPVDPIYSRSVANLHLMRRLDLNAALTKINLWRQTQFRKIVYVDADMVCLRAPEELFDVDADFAASPDIGWPDCFNSGLMMVKPDMETFGKLAKLAAAGQSFDGADQGLLNQHYEGSWHRLSFVYNCTVGSSMGYQYAPAFKHYGSKVSMAHFIGSHKPWMRGEGPSGSGEPYDKLSAHWWGVWNRHNAKEITSSFQTQSWSARSQDYVDHLTRSHGIGGEGGGSFSHAELHSILQQDHSARQNKNHVHWGSTPHRDSVDSNSSGDDHHRWQFLQAQPSAQYAHHEQQHQHQQQQHYQQQHHEQQHQQQHHEQQHHGQGAIVLPVISVEHATKFVPIRSINQPSRYHENFTHHHYQRYATEGKLGEYVVTKEGSIPQSLYFQTSADTYHIQKYQPDGRPIPIVEPVTPEFREEFTAPQQDWDPSKYPPPQHGLPEAHQLQIKTYENEWDNKKASRPFKAPSYAPPPKHLWYEIPDTKPHEKHEPAVKAIFPWESKPRQVTRVFTEDFPPDPESDSEDEEPEEYYTEEEIQGAVEEHEHHGHHGHIEPTHTPVEPVLKPVFPWEDKPRTVTRVFTREDFHVPMERFTEDEGELSGMPGSDSDWRRFVARENKWDTDPAIRDYVLGLRKRRTQKPGEAVEPPTEAPEVPPITPVPIRRIAPAWVEGEEEHESEEEPEWDPEKKLEELRRHPPSILSQLIAKIQNGDGGELGRDKTKSGTLPVTVRTLGNYEDPDIDLRAIAGIPVDDHAEDGSELALGSAIGE